MWEQVIDQLGKLVLTLCVYFTARPELFVISIFAIMANKKDSKSKPSNISNLKPFKKHKKAA